MKFITPRKSPRTQPMAARPIARGRNSTAAVDEREKVLLKDPLCQIINPHLTQCRGCGTEIKLSPKMLFDTCHWLAHSGRCARPLLPEARIRRRLGSGDNMSESGESQRSDSSRSSSGSSAETLEVAEYLLLLSGRHTKN